MDTIHVSFDITTCTSTKTNSVAFAVTERDGARSAISITTYKDIKSWEVFAQSIIFNLLLQIPALQKLMDEVDSQIANVSQTEATLLSAKKDKLQEALSGWRTILNYIDSVKERAKQGDLSAQGLSFEDSVSNLRNLDLSQSTSVDKASLQKFNRITISGGGHSISYSESVAHETSSSSQQETFESSIETKEIGLKVGLGLAGFEFSLAVGVSRTETTSNARGSESTKSAARGFTLSDPDVGDKAYSVLPNFELTLFS